MSATYPTKLILAFRSGNMCAFPGCSRALTEDGDLSGPAVIGVAAHIAGENPGSARYDKSMDDNQRNDFNNLIYLCGNHHAQIDKQELDYSVEKLLQMKANHEQRVQEFMSEHFADVSFPELKKATEWIMTINSNVSDQDFSLIPPEDKLRKNKLGDGSRNIITMGLSVARSVSEFIKNTTQFEPEFPERLKTGFLAEYYRLKQKGHTGDDLFNLMCIFAQRGLEGPVQQSAGIAVLVYLFEACEIFEK